MYVPFNKRENVDQDLVKKNVPIDPNTSTVPVPQLKIDPDFASKKQIDNINNIASSQSVQSDEQQPEKRNGRKVLIVILVLLLLIGIGAACFYVATTGNNAPANTNTQAKNSEPKIKVTSVSANIDDFD